MSGSVLLTGGAGYIGTHICVALVEAGYDPVILDNFANSRRSVLERLASVTGRPVRFEEADVTDEGRVLEVLLRHGVTSVVHLAAKKSVLESIRFPLQYVSNNVGGLLSVLRAMEAAGVHHMVFSSSATVYGHTDRLPIPETCPRGFLNPYGFSKLACEQILEQMEAADPRWKFSILRYLNPVGAHPSGLIGDDPLGEPANLMPIIGRVATGRAPMVRVFGGDFDTPDGAGIRDYVHISDLAEGHVLSLRGLFEADRGHVVNLGTGKGHSVLEVIRAYVSASGRDVPYEICARRPGDAAASWADVTRAKELLGFEARRDLDEMCRSSWKFAAANAG